MKKLLTFIILSCMAQTALATTPDRPGTHANKNLSVNIDVSLQRQAKDGGLSRHHIKKMWETAINNHEWRVIQDENNDNGRILLLSRVKSADAHQVEINFLVLDTEGKTSTIISAPEMIVQYGREGKLIMSESKQKMQLSVKATAG